MAQPPLASRPMAEAGEALPWHAGGGSRSILVSWRRCPVGKHRLEHVGDAGNLLEWLEEDGAHREWFSTAVALKRRRVASGRTEGSRPTLKWTSRFIGLGRRLWPCQPGRWVDGEGQLLQCGHRGGRRWCRVAPGQLWVVTSTRRRQRRELPRGRPSKLGTLTAWLLRHSGMVSGARRWPQQAERVTRQSIGGQALAMKRKRSGRDLLLVCPRAG
jgi:hypothetical protein